MNNNAILHTHIYIRLDVQIINKKYCHINYRTSKCVCDLYSEMSEKRRSPRNIAKNKGSCHRYPPSGREISTLITSIANRYRSITWPTRTSRYTYYRQLRANVTRRLLLEQVESKNLTTRMTLKFGKSSILISTRNIGKYCKQIHRNNRIK